MAPYGPFTTIDSNNDVGRARYDSLQVKAETKSARHGLYALLGYTWSRTFDSGFPDGVGTSPGATYWPLPGQKQADWSLSQLNLNDQFTASVIYDLPFGKGKAFGANWHGPVNAVLGNWQVNVIEKVTTGFPLFVVASDQRFRSQLRVERKQPEPAESSGRSEYCRHRAGESYLRCARQDSHHCQLVQSLRF